MCPTRIVVSNLRHKVGANPRTSSPKPSSVAGWRSGSLRSQGRGEPVAFPDASPLAFRWEVGSAYRSRAKVRVKVLDFVKRDEPIRVKAWTVECICVIQGSGCT